MCLTAPARVVSVLGDVAVVEHDGRRRTASLQLLSDARPGDWVLLGAGAALRRLDPTEARELLDLIATARIAAAARDRELSRGAAS